MINKLKNENNYRKIIRTIWFIIIDNTPFEYNRTKFMIKEKLP